MALFRVWEQHGDVATSSAAVSYGGAVLEEQETAAPAASRSRGESFREAVSVTAPAPV